MSRLQGVSDDLGDDLGDGDSFGGGGDAADFDDARGCAVGASGDMDDGPMARARLPRRAKSNNLSATAVDTAPEGSKTRRPSLPRRAKQWSAPTNATGVVDGRVATGTGAGAPSTRERRRTAGAAPGPRKRRRTAGAVTPSTAFPLRPIGAENARSMLRQQEKFKAAYSARRASDKGVRCRNVVMLLPSGKVEVTKVAGFGDGRPFVAVRRAAWGARGPTLAFSISSMYSGGPPLRTVLAEHTHRPQCSRAPTSNANRTPPPSLPPRRHGRSSRVLGSRRAGGQLPANTRCTGCSASLDLAMGEVEGVETSMLAAVDSDPRAIRVLEKKRRENDSRVASLNGARILHHEIGTGVTASEADLGRFLREIHDSADIAAAAACPRPSPTGIRMHACFASPSCHANSQANTKSPK